MKKREAGKNTQWNHYVREKKFYGYFELKQTSAKSWAFSKFEPHQLESLIALEEGGMTWKFSDQDERQKPCDSICIPPMPAYLVIKFKPCFVAIRIKELVKYLENHLIKSISYEDACKIAEKIVYQK